jgi:GntR family transcriptional regulator
MLDARVLDRNSVVPLYYQLQEILKERIESSEWAPGSTLPAETQLARLYGVSRICVRQALRILEDDREIVRVQGRGTFVAERKILHRPAGILGLRTDPHASRLVIRVLDTKIGVAEPAILTLLDAAAADVGRLTALWLRDDEPFSIGQHFFCRDLPLLAGAVPGRVLRAEPADDTAVDVSITVETTQCGPFEADLLGIPNRSTFLLTFGSVRAADDATAPPVEVFRLGFRGDSVQLVLRS